MSKLNPVMSSPSASVSICSSTGVFGNGAFKTKVIKPDEKLTPKPLMIVTPVEAGDFPVLILLHGFLLFNSFYTQLSKQIASHGFILVVPQLYTLPRQDATREIERVVEITKWLTEGLSNFLPLHVKANLKKLGLAGHSRGGKVAFAAALKPEMKSRYTALIGIDPVDGKDKGNQTLPKVLTYVPHSFNLDMPVMVIGSGLGEVKTYSMYPACAPKGVNHEEFYNECRKPACYFVAKDYGHLDMLDDETNGMRGQFTYCMCKHGKSREPMRSFVGGVIVAFFSGCLKGDFRCLIAIKDEKDVPVVIQKCDFQL